MSNITIDDVAKMAGVSAKTVSRVANNEPNVREQTRLKVRSVIEQLNYQPNPYARYLGSLSPRSKSMSRVAPEQQ